MLVRDDEYPKYWTYLHANYGMSYHAGWYCVPSRGAHPVYYPTGGPASDYSVRSGVYQHEQQLQAATALSRVTRQGQPLSS